MVTFVSPGGAAGVLFTPVTFNSALTPLRPPLVSTTRPKGRGARTQGSEGGKIELGRPGMVVVVVVWRRKEGGCGGSRSRSWCVCGGWGCAELQGENGMKRKKGLWKNGRGKKKDSPGNREEKKGVDSKIVSGGR